MNILAQISGLVGILINIIGIQFKDKKSILISFILANVVFGFTFLLLGSYSGALICAISAIQTIIKYFFDKKNKKFPLYLIIVYIIVSVTGGILVYKSKIDIYPIFCSILYVLTIVQTKEKNIRIITFINVIAWTIYDLYIGLYSVALNDIWFSISTLIAIYRYDIFNKILLKRIEEFAVYCLPRFYGEDVIELDNGKLVYNNVIEDYYWNYITYVDVNDTDEFNCMWNTNKKYLIDKKRIPALYILPTSKLIKKKEIIPDYMKVESNEIWMLLDNYKKINKIKKSKLDLTINSNPDIKEFIDTFMKSYDSSSEADPYGKLPDTYRKLLEISKKIENEYKKTYYVAYNDAKPIATTITIEKDDIALICFVGTIKEYRNRGICKSLMKSVINDLKNKKIKHIFLQTEEGFIPEKIYSSIGFIVLGKSLLMTEKGDE